MEEGTALSGQEEEGKSFWEQKEKTLAVCEERQLYSNHLSAEGEKPVSRAHNLQRELGNRPFAKGMDGWREGWMAPFLPLALLWFSSYPRHTRRNSPRTFPPAFRIPLKVSRLLCQRPPFPQRERERI